MKKLLILGSFVLQYTLLLAMEPQFQQSQSNVASERYNLFFLGESCAGKTTLMQQLSILNNKEFFMPKFTMTRLQRVDDDLELIEFVTIEQYTKSRELDEFIFDMDDSKTYYGYKKKNWQPCNKHTLMYGSPYFIEQSRKMQNTLLILVEADKKKGFLSRQDSNEIKEKRHQSNKLLSEAFFDKDSFRRRMDLIFYNKFGNSTESAKQLLQKIIYKISEQSNALNTGTSC